MADINIGGTKGNTWEKVTNILDQMELKSGDDTGVNFEQELSVGTPLAGKEAVFGGGDSYPVGFETGSLSLGSAWHCDIANTTGTIITSATDVTEILASDSGSTTGLFDGTTSGKYALFGSSAPFRGFKAKIDTLGTVEAASVVFEYLATDDTWVDVGAMATNANFPYEQKGNNLGTCSSCSEQWRFGFNPDYFPDVMWTPKTLNINGTDYTKIWGRIRLVAPITQDITLEQIKLHTDRAEFNADGTSEYFGVARYPKTILIEKHPNVNKNPANESISIAPGVTEQRVDNQFNNNTEDGFILSGVVPVGLDTSIPVQVIIDWYPMDNGAGNVQLNLDIIAATNGFVYDGTATPVSLDPIEVAVNGQDEELQRTTFWVDVRTGLPNDKVYGSLYRDGNADSYSGNIAITGYQVVGYFWRP